MGLFKGCGLGRELRDIAGSEGACAEPVEPASSGTLGRPDLPITTHLEWRLILVHAQTSRSTGRQCEQRGGNPGDRASRSRCRPHNARAMNHRRQSREMRMTVGAEGRRTHAPGRATHRREGDEDRFMVDSGSPNPAGDANDRRSQWANRCRNPIAWMYNRKGRFLVII